ncbi:nucleotidyltransferase family protein [Spirosoma luteum]|uniref:nucleotidyltransferase family protein n=1 Tax=Spirosoma luteum TaxID=431553 RepID=UPI00037F3F63|nr:nucleotidyltransferase domain-containing protein [Spirosoma luteum]
MPYGLTDTQITEIQRVLAQTPRLERAVLFGSRAKGTHKPGSDIDLALIGDTFQFADRLRLDNELDDLDLPVFFDLVVYRQISEPALREHIDRVGVTLYSRQKQTTKHYS